MKPDECQCHFDPNGSCDRNPIRKYNGLWMCAEHIHAWMRATGPQIVESA